MAIERELKFRIAPRLAARAARLLELGRPRALSAVYFDTPTRALAGGRAALRLRRDGGKWLQTFKCEKGLGERGEWEVPALRGKLDMRRFPGEEIRVACGIDLAALSLRPLFETRFKRQTACVRSGKALIEVALDRGHLLAGGRKERICELEVELKSGKPAALFRYARSLIEPLGLELDLDSKAARGYRLGLRESLPPLRWRRPDIAHEPPHRAFTILAAATIEQVAVNARGVATRSDPEHLHQLRVGLRRFRAVLAAFRALEPESRALNRRRRAFSATLGLARDWDVFVQGLSSRPLRRAAARHHAHARDAARRTVRSAAFSLWLVHALRWLNEARWNTTQLPIADFAGQSLERLLRKTMKAAKGIDWSDAPARHALRIRVKRLRYACDAFSPAFPAGSARAYLGALERLQDDFGALNDIAVARRLMAALPSDRALGRKLGAAERRLIARVPRDWRTFARQKPFWRADK